MRDNGIDLLKFICCLLIVGLHSCLFLDRDPNISYIFMNGISRIAVPLFLIISGYYFYNIRDDHIKIKKWIKKLLIPYFVFSFLFIPFWKENINLPNLIHFFFMGYFQLWYIPALILSLLVYIFFKNKTYIIIISSFIFFIFNLLFQYSFAYGHFLSLDYNEIKRNFFFTYPYFVIGIMMSKKYQNFKNIKTFYLILCLIFILLLGFLEVEHNFYFSGKPMDNLFCLPFLCIIIFLLFKRISIKKSMNFLNYYTTGIFFTHGIFILVLHSYKLDTFYVFGAALFLSILSCYFYSGLLFLYHYYKKILITKRKPNV